MSCTCIHRHTHIQSYLQYLIHIVSNTDSRTHNIIYTPLDTNIQSGTHIHSHTYNILDTQTVIHTISYIHS